MSIAIIPARYGSERFPGKPLVEIQGKSLIRRTYENTKRCRMLSRVLVATDDQRIYDHVVSFGGEAVMTSVDCPNGTERLLEVLQRLPELGEADFLINVQGDEPCLEPETLNALASALVDSDEPMATVITPLRSESDYLSPSIVKCVVDTKGDALYFSRAPIPGNKKGEWTPDVPVYRHLGLYAYRSHFLPIYAALSPSPLQMTEDLEQLKALEHGYKIRTALVEEDGIGVDVPEDIQKVEAWLKTQSISLSPVGSSPL